MNNQLDYVTLDSRTGKVTFKANSLKPHVLINTESIVEVTIISVIIQLELWDQNIMMLSFMR